MTSSTLTARLGRTVFSPYVSGTWLALLLYQRQRLSSNKAAHAALAKVARTLLTIIFVLGSTSRLSSALDRWALNNWRLSPRKGWKWDGEVAVVTGGCSGIGKAIAGGLSKKGVRVAILDVSQPPEDVENDYRIKYFHCDIASPDAVHEAAVAIRSSLGNPSILINNAGVSNAAQGILQDDVLMSLCPRWSRQNKGHVVTVASMASFGTRPNTADYSASKSAAWAFHEGLDIELKYRHKVDGVLTTIVHPFWVHTGMTHARAEDIEKAWGPMLKPEDVAAKVLDRVFGRIGGQVLVPDNALMAMISTIRSWPTWLQILLRDARSIFQ